MMRPNLRGEVSPVSWVLPDNLSLSEWQEEGLKLGQGQTRQSWQLGIWWVYGETNYGARKAAMTASHCHLNIKTCMNIGSVIRKFETSRRREVLSFKHHAEVCSLDADEADAMLEWAENGPTGKPRSVTELREEVKRYKREKHAAAFEPVYGNDVRLEQGDCLQRMATLAADSVAMVLTSPPYGDLRAYGGDWTVDIPALGKGIYRVLKPGGVVVVVINDPIENGIQRTDSERLVIDWIDNARLNKFQTLIYHRNGTPGLYGPHFRPDHEYMIVFFKGDQPSYVNAAALDILRQNSGAQQGRTRDVNGGLQSIAVGPGEHRSRGTVWKYNTGTSNFDQSPDAVLQRKHPATFPLQLALDHVLCWTQPGNLVLDPMIGSGTTAVACLKTGRRCIGFDVSSEYLSIARQRVDLLRVGISDASGRRSLGAPRKARMSRSALPPALGSGSEDKGPPALPNWLVRAGTSDGRRVG